jgi:ornithine cyclodeaminase/alanine dehydrogenase-like protein (mu-crystallin family)
MDGNYITALRTGAVAALCVETLAVKNYSELA